MKRSGLCAAIMSLLAVSHVHAVVFLNEIFINPPSSDDSTREFIELLGTPGKKLDGYAVAVINGGVTKYYPAGSMPPIPADGVPEIDEFYSLDGLSLGDNGLLVLGIGGLAQYPTMLPEAHFQKFANIWNGGLDTPGKLSNDGSNTIILIRNRPGNTQKSPSTPIGLRWGKDINHDRDLVRDVVDPSDGLVKDTFGDGRMDNGQIDLVFGPLFDMKGSSTPDDLSDDLEIVDEISYEDGAGWEYDEDDRHVDNDSIAAGLPRRQVHALGDQRDVNPDALTRVDYRTKGLGWKPVAGATGELPNGNNWQDTATEQWIRGESAGGTSGVGAGRFYYYSVAGVIDPAAIQPYETNVPSWLHDGSDVDFDFAGIADNDPSAGAAVTRSSYQIMPGRANPLAIPFIPGDTDRDGDCDADDIAKIARVFGNADWIFSNSFEAAAESDSGDPATQIRPWDVDATGDNGVEPTDLQWTLNFQGDTTGRVAGVHYDAAGVDQGVRLNANSGTAVAVSVSATVPSGRALGALKTNDTIELTVSSQVTSGANTLPGQENGIMQFVHDLDISNPGVLRVVGVQAIGPFHATRAAIQHLEGAGGDAGMTSMNGYTTSFSQGLSAADAMYRVTLQAIGVGTADVALSLASSPQFAASAPQGLKIGHTRNNGDPANATYPQAITLTVATRCPGFDVQGDGDVDKDDYDAFLACVTGPALPIAATNTAECSCFDVNGDGAIDQSDFGFFQRCYSGPGPAYSVPGCDVP